MEKGHAWGGWLTRFHRAVNVCFGFIVDPVEASFHSQASQHAIFASVPVRCGDVHCSALIVQRLFGMMAILIPALSHTQLHSRPLVHHRDGQGIQLVFAPL